MSKKILCFFVLGFFLVSLSYSQDNILVTSAVKFGAEEEAFFKKASSLFMRARKQDYENVVKTYNDFILKYPNSELKDKAQYMKGEINFLKFEALADKRKNEDTRAALESAIEEYTKVLKSEDDFLNFNAEYRIAECYYNLGDLERSFSICQKLPYNYFISDVLYLFVITYLRIIQTKNVDQEQWTIVEDVFKNLESEKMEKAKNEKQIKIYFALGLTYFGKQEYLQAIKYLKLIDTDKSRYFLGKSYEFDDRYLLAIGEYKALIRKYPNSEYIEKAAYSIAECLYDSEDYESAIQSYNEFRQTYAKSKYNDYIDYKIGCSNYFLGEYLTSADYFKKVDILKKAPPKLVLYNHFLEGESYYNYNNLKQAITAYEKCVTKFPYTQEAMKSYFMASWCYFWLENYSETEKIIKKAISALSSENVLFTYMYYLLGTAQYMQGKQKDARASFRMVVDRSKGDDTSNLRDAAFFMMNWISYKQEDYKIIVTQYQFELNNIMPIIDELDWRMNSYFVVADACYRMRYFQEAKDFFTRIADEYSRDDVIYAKALDGIAWCEFEEKNYSKAIRKRTIIADIIENTDQDLTEIHLSNYFELGNIYFNDKKYLKALNNYNLFVENAGDHKDVPDALYRAGICYYREEYYTSAVNEWKKIVEKYPTHKNAAAVAYKIADTYYKSGQYKDSVQFYNYIIKHFEKNSQEVNESYLRIPQSYFNAKDYDNACIHFKKFITLFPDSPKAISAIDSIETSLYRKQELEAYLKGLKSAEINIAADFEKMFADFVKNNQKLSIVSEIIHRMAKNYYNEGNYKKAIQKYTHFFNLGGYDTSDTDRIAESQYNLAESYYITEQFNNAVTSYNMLINNFSTFEQIERVYFRLGSAYLKLKDYSNSKNTYTTLIDYYPETEYMRLTKYNLGISNKSLGKINEACLAFIDYYTLEPTDPNSIQIMLEVGEMYMKQRDYNDAISAFAEVLNTVEGKEKILVQFKIAECYEKQFNNEKAIVEYKGLMDMSPINDMTRIGGLIKAAELLEADKAFEEAYYIYKDVLEDIENEQWEKVIKLRIQDLEGKISK